MHEGNEAILLRNARTTHADDLVDLMVAGDLVQEVGQQIRPDESTATTRVIDLEGRFVIPGFVNAHAHLDKAFQPGTAEDATYRAGLLYSRYGEAKRAYTVADVTTRAERAIQWALRTGTTAMRTHVDVDADARLIPMEALVALRDRYRDTFDLQIVAFAQEGLFAQSGVEAMMREACEMGADLIGGKPRSDRDEFRRHIDVAFDLAKEYGLGIDLHVDTNIEADYASHLDDDGCPAEFEMVHMARNALEYSMHGVTASHACALSCVPPPASERTMDLLKEARMAVISCPSANLYGLALQDTSNVRRGITRVRELYEAGVTVAIATDNFVDAYNLFSGPDMLAHLWLSAIACHMQTKGDLNKMLEMATTIPAQILGLPEHGPRAGAVADLVVLEADNLLEAVVGIVPRRLVLKRGRIVHDGSGEATD